MNNKFVVIDLETTGNSPKKGDRIIQFAAVVIENGEIIETFSSLVNPHINIPIFIEELTGIGDEMTKDAPVFEEIAPKIQSLLKDAYFVAHNVLFDLSFLQEELLMANQEGFFGSVIDTVELARFLLPTVDSYKLSDLASLLGFQHDRPHQADSDAEVTAQLLLFLLSKLESIPLLTCRQLMELSGGLKSDIQLLFDEIIEMKSHQKEIIPAYIDFINGVGIRNLKTETKYNSSKVMNNDYPFDEQEKEVLLKNAFHNYQRRIGQFQMMDDVYYSFLNNRHLIIEAGTGIGKSMGYLLPAAYFSKLSGEKVVISTYTTQQQTQLLQKDIPSLEKILPFKPRIALLKGRSHYIDLSKFEKSLHEIEDNYDTSLTKMQILNWLLETSTGDVDELNLSSGGQIFWDRIKHSNQNNYKVNELWLERDFYAYARTKVQEADIIITNHHYLLTDYNNTGAFLASTSYLVLDEGHHFSKVASRHFGAQLDYYKLRLLLNRLGVKEQKQLFFKLYTLMQTYDKENLNLYEVLNKQIIEAFFEMDEFFKMIKMYAKNYSNSDALYKVSCKINYHDQAYTRLFYSAERFSFQLKEIVDSVQTYIDSLKNKKSELNKNSLLDDILQCSHQLSEVRQIISRIFLKPSIGDVTWIEIDFRSYQNSTSVFLQPVDISKQIQDKFYKQNNSIILTSATLSIDEDFKFVLNELGLNKSEIKTVSIPSPFDYRNKVKIYVPKDLPDIKFVSQDDYITAISEQIISIAEVTKGRMLILFTSQDMLRKSYTLIKESGLLEEYALIAQGITGGSRSRLTRNFQKFEKAILFGNSSFWEGIDIPGEDLSCLIMVRLPFVSPEEPYFQARYEVVKEKGGNPFMEVALPEAVIRFKQGFGRLIRTENDKGVMIVLDRRIVTTRYGGSFIRSIPTASIKELEIKDIVDKISNWL